MESMPWLISGSMIGPAGEYDDVPPVFPGVRDHFRALFPQHAKVGGVRAVGGLAGGLHLARRDAEFRPENSAAFLRNPGTVHPEIGMEEPVFFSARTLASISSG